MTASGPVGAKACGPGVVPGAAEPAPVGRALPPVLHGLTGFPRRGGGGVKLGTPHTAAVETTARAAGVNVHPGTEGQGSHVLFALLRLSFLV